MQVPALDSVHVEFQGFETLDSDKGKELIV
jgi:hypothetical protein